MIGYTLMYVSTRTLEIVCTNDMKMGLEAYADSGRIWIDRLLAEKAASDINNCRFLTAAGGPVYIVEVLLPDPLTDVRS